MFKRYRVQTKSIRLTAKLGDLIDYYYDLREEKRMLKSMVGEIDARMKKIENAAFEKMRKQKIKSSKADHSQGTIAKKTSYTIDDWDEFYAFAKRKGNEDLLSQSCNGSAVKNREEEGKKVPGVKKNVRVYLSVTKFMR